MQIWVDADACPVVIKDILFRVANRTHIVVTLVANQYIRTPPSLYIQFIQVAAGFDVADNEIVQRIAHGDIVITGDIPLASEVIEKGAVVINPRGELYSPENIKARLSQRDFMETLRSSGVYTNGQSPLNQADRQKFANQLDRLLTKYVKVL